MTVIATDGKTMAADGQTLAGWTICSTESRKLRLLSDGRVMGSTGYARDKAQFTSWLDAGSDLATLPKLHDDFNALVIDGSAVIREYDNTGHYLELPAPQAVGCASGIAFGAMDMGADPLRAVEVACARSAGCGGTITTMTYQGEA